MRQPRKPINDFKKERKKERKKLFVNGCFFFFCKLKEQNFLLTLSSVKFVNDFDESINFHSVNFR